ncbi:MULTISPECIES: HNH endonuclease [Rhodopseudomonas]|nr:MULTISPECIES: HNH endonuclease [Rhodopseudomonas]
MTDRVVSAGETYRAAARAGRLHTVEKMPATTHEARCLSKVYDRRMAAREGSGRAVYDEIKASIARCPYCGDGEVYELDHFLPQRAFPDLNVLPINLVPICHPCNHIKLQRKPNGANRTFLHPYFDRLPQDIRWLFAELKSLGNGPVLTYRVELDESQHGAIAHRLSYHFYELQLGRRFKEASATILVELEAILDEHLGQFDAAQMAAHYNDLGLRSLRLHGNRLETAAYFAAAENADYCSGNYRN